MRTKLQSRSALVSQMWRRKRNILKTLYNGCSGQYTLEHRADQHLVLHLSSNITLSGYLVAFNPQVYCKLYISCPRFELRAFRPNLTRSYLHL